MPEHVYRVTRAIVRRDEIALLHDKHQSVMIITIDGDRFTTTEPDGEERLDWLLRLGAITPEDAEEQASKLPAVRKRRLVERLQSQLEAE